MNRNLAIVLCLIGMVGICGVGNTGNTDTTQTLMGHEEGISSAIPKSLTPEALAGVNLRARVEKTGQTISFGPRDDGTLEKGLAWPSPRFTDNGDGTVTDNLTGLIWLKNANCEVFFDGDTTGKNSRNWRSALRAANRLADGYCGLTTGPVTGKWRLPNAKELQSLIDFAFLRPAISNTAGTGQWTEGDPFSGVQFDYHWTSTTFATDANLAWIVSPGYGGVRYHGLKTDEYFVWPVR